MLYPAGFLLLIGAAEVVAAKRYNRSITKGLRIAVLAAAGIGGVVFMPTLLGGLERRYNIHWAVFYGVLAGIWVAFWFYRRWRHRQHS